MNLSTVYDFEAEHVQNRIGHIYGYRYTEMSTHMNSPESGEHPECQSFYNQLRHKMSNGMVAGSGDYDAGWDDKNNDRDAETWYAADPASAE